jgi:acyl-CoA synthetase (AMP-forming)/AMP-acid ligase II
MDSGSLLTLWAGLTSLIPVVPDNIVSLGCSKPVASVSNNSIHHLVVCLPYGVPEQIVFVEALRKTSVGKLDKKLLRERSVGLEGAPEGRK